MKACIAAFLLWLIVAAAAAAQEAITPELSGGTVGGNARLIFKWPETVHFQAQHAGRTVTLIFDKPVNIDLAPVLPNLQDFLINGDVDASGLRLTLNLTAPYDIKPFMSKNLTGIDLIRTAETDAATRTAAPTPQVDSSTLPLPQPPLNTALKGPSPSMSSPAASDTASMPQLRVYAEEIEGHGRVTFDWNVPVRYRVRSENGRTVVEFDRLAAPALPIIPPEAERYFHSVSSSTLSGTLAYTLDVPEKARIKYTHEQQVVMVDILLPETEQTATAPAAKPTQRKESAEEEARLFAHTPSPKIKPSPPAIDATARAPVTQTTVAAAPVPTVEDAPAAPPAPLLDTTPSAREEAAEALTAVTTPVTDQEQAADAPAHRIRSVEDFLRDIRQEKGRMSLPFLWEKPTAAAVFERLGYTWIVFDRLSDPELGKLAGLIGVNQITRMPHKFYTVLRLPTPATSPFLSTGKSEEDWQVHFNQHPIPLRDVIPIEPNPESQLGPHLFLPVTGASEPVTLTDPLTGERLTVIPTMNPGQGVPVTRHFVDLTVWASAQGIVIAPRRESVETALQRNGVMLTSGKGLQLSPDLPAPDPTALSSPEKTDSFLHYGRMRGDLTTPFADRKSWLERKSAANMLQPTAAAWRMKLAQLYLAEGFYLEALALMNRIAETSPDLMQSSLLNAYRGVAYAMTGDMDNARAALADPQYDRNPEVALWRGLVMSDGEEPGAPQDFEAAFSRYIHQYPPEIAATLMLNAAEQSLRNRHYPEATTILDRVDSLAIPPSMRKQSQFLRGLIAADTYRTAQAIEAWEPLTEDLNERKYRARAGFALTELLLSKNKIDKQEAIDRLDKLAIVWRGDDQEMRLLYKLGQYYLDEKQYADGLRSWRELVTHFPETPLSTEVAQKMTDTFIRLFNRGEADSLPPLDALALFYEFRELTPLGEEGDTMIQHLADRLAAIDLLDRAAALLTHQVQYRLKDAEKSRVGARIALLHLLNHEPEKAKKILEETEFKDNPAPVAATRRQLMAKALAETGQYEDALNLVHDDSSETASMLKVDTLWNMGDWARTAAFLENTLAGREQRQEPLTSRESENILRLGLAYLFAGEQDKLPGLRDRFAEAMKGNPYEKTFAFITKDTVSIDHTNFDRINEEIKVFQSFMDNFRGSVSQNGLSQTIE